MSANVVITLDTTGPELDAQINGGDPSTANETVTLTLAAEDAGGGDIEVKIWGSINPLDPLNADYAEAEGDALWHPFDDSWLVVLSAGDGPKVLNVKVRDEVLNETQANPSIVLGAYVPPEPVATPPPGYPSPKPQRPGRTRKEAHSRIRARTTVSRTESRTITQTTRVRVRSEVHAGEQFRQVASGSVIHARTRVASTSARTVQQPAPARVRTTTAVGKADSEELLAILLILPFVD